MVSYLSISHLSEYTTLTCVGTDIASNEGNRMEEATQEQVERAILQLEREEAADEIIVADEE